MKKFEIWTIYFFFRQFSHEFALPNENLAINICHNADMQRISFIAKYFSNKF